jgi:lipopolysaccharide/colanic/teichoic acid biosynthesis glycosyltransferase
MDWQVESEPFEELASTTSPSLEDTWMSMLTLMEYCSIGRLVYVYIVKRCLDIFLAATTLLFLTPLLILIGCAIYLNMGGPVIFRQARIGKHGRPFVMYKFRTMIADRRKTHIPYTGEERRRRHKTSGDPRVTRFGRLLRNTSLDELPQLFNILRGHMSLIGPRPELPEIVDRYAIWQHRRHLIPPGLTGWWQVQGRSDLPMHEHTDLDLYYVSNLSFRLDLQILIRTVRTVLSRHGAF